MRTQLLCALTLLCGAAIAQAQAWPTYPNNAPTYAWGNQAAPGQPAYPQPVRGYPYYQGYQNQGYQNSPAYYQYSAPGSYVVPSGAPAALPEGQAAPPAAAVQAETPMPAFPADPAIVDDPGDDVSETDSAGGAAGTDRFWLSVSYSFIYLKPGTIGTPLLTIGAPGDTPPGAIGQPGTVILFGDRVDYGQSSGIRPNVGVFLDPDNRLSVEWEGLFVIPRRDSLFISSDGAGNPIITRPIFNVLAQQERTFLSSSPNIAAGSTQVEARSEMFGSELNARYYLQPPRQAVRADTLLGFRFLRLSEQITIKDQLTPITNNGQLTFLGVPVNPPNSLADVDNFQTTNRFYGLQVGGRLRYDTDWLSFAAFGKLALGATDQQVDINGSSTLITPGGTQVAGGGVLALPTNIGHHTRTVIGFIPEVGVNIGLKLTSNIDVLTGYSFLFWNQVVRPGSQISRSINPNFVPTDQSFGPGGGPLQPAFRFNEDTFWLHSVNIGMNIHF